MAEPDDKKKSILDLDPQIRRLVLVLGYMIVAAGLIVGLTVIWPAIKVLLNVLMPFLVALVVAYIFNPIVNFVQRKMKLTRIGGVLIVNILVIGIAVGFVAIVIPILITQVRNAYNGIRSTTEREVIPWISEQILITPGHLNSDAITDFQQYYRANHENLDDDISPEDFNIFLEDWTSKTSVEPIVASEFNESATEEFIDSKRTTETAQLSINKDDIASKIEDWKTESEQQEQPVTWEDFEFKINELLLTQGTSLNELATKAYESSQVRSAARSAAEGSASLFGRFLSLVGSVVMSLVSSTIFLVFVIILTFYLLLDFSSLRGVIEILTPDQYEDRMFAVFEKIDEAVGGFIRGQLIVAIIVGTITFVGLWILGMKQYALLIGFIAGIGNTIPYLGPIAGATPAVLYMLLTDSHDTTQVKLIYLSCTVGLFGMIQAIEGLVLQPKIVGNSANLHPIAVILALALGGQFGIMGMIIAVPMACIIRVLWKEFLWDDLRKEWHKTTGKNKLDDPMPKKRKKK